MKRFLLVGIFAALLIAFTAANYPVAAQEPAPTPKPTRARTRVPKATPIPQPAPPLVDETEAEEAIEISPTAPGPMTSQILIFNPDAAGAATVQIDIYNTSGVVAYTTTVNVSKNGAKLVTLPGSLGVNFQGGAQISSDKNVQALVVGANSNKKARDSYEGANAPALNVTLPFVRHLAASTQNAILAIQNTTANSANVSLMLYNPDGTTAYQQNPVIAAHQVVYFNTDTLIPSGTFLGSARVVSNQNIAVAMQALYYQDTAAFLGMTANETDTSIFLNQAQRKINSSSVATNWSEIFARNNGTNPTNVTIDFYATTGALVTSQTATNVAPNGMTQFMLNDAAFSALGDSYNGWAKITSSGEPLAVSALQVLSKGKRLYGGNGLANSQTSSRYVCGDAQRAATQNSRISILNTDGAATAKVQVRLYDKDSGAKLATFKVNVAPNSLSEILLSDSAFSAAGTEYQGMAIVEAKGATPPKIVVTVNNPYGSSKLTGTTGYTCSKIP